MEKFNQINLLLLILIFLYFPNFDSVICEFSVLNYGAKGDGVTDDSNAFQAALQAACNVSGGVMLIPRGPTFLLQPITFNGNPCKPNFVFRVEGKIVAPLKQSSWQKDVYQWILFSGFAKGITLTGKGVIDGHGEAWWSSENELKATAVSLNNHPLHSGNELSEDYEQKETRTRPHAISVDNSYNVTINGITVQNSPRMHIYIDNSQEVNIYNVTVSSPKDSPNTDGIHLTSTQHAKIYQSNLACGDDCISIQRGCSDIRVHDIHCGPGHGYSIGGLGQNNERAEVSNVIIRDSTSTDSLSGVRIKTWQGGSGFVRNVTFSNIRFGEVEKPIVIDQYYCGGPDTCPTKPSAVAISDITYENMLGSYTKTSVYLACSRSQACKGITFRGKFMLKPTMSAASLVPNCSNAFGQVMVSNPSPPLNNCLKSG